MAVTDGWRGFTHDYKSPIGSDWWGLPWPVHDSAPAAPWDGSVPHAFPQILVENDDGTTFPYVDVTLATWPAGGWSYWPEVAGALRTAGLWSSGWPSRVFLVEGAPDAVERAGTPGSVAGPVVVVRGPEARTVVIGGQYVISPAALLTLDPGRTIRRASQITMIREATAGEITDAITELSAAFAPFATELRQQQELWRLALSRPFRNAANIATHLNEALAARGLSAWTLQQFSSLGSLLSTAATQPASLLRLWSKDAADRAEVAVYANNPVAWHARDIWTRRTRSPQAGDEYSVSAAYDGMMVYLAGMNSWTADAPLRLTTGIRDAFEDGLLHALPTGATQLGWVMRTDTA